MIARLAAAQAGRVARWQLLAAGVTRRQIEERVRTGHLHLAHRGVYAVGHDAPAPRSAAFAAWLALGPAAAVSHRSAAHELDLRADHRAVVDVTAPRHTRSRPGIVAHQAVLAPADLQLIAGLPVTSFGRTALDLAADLPVLEVTRLLERAERLRIYDQRALDDVIARNLGHHGAGALRRAIAEIDPRHGRTRSGWERDVLPLLDDLGLPRPLVNHPFGPYELDLFWPEYGVAVELDSWEHHADRESFEHDRDKIRHCAARGVTCLPFTWRQVRDGALRELVPLLAPRP